MTIMLIVAVTLLLADVLLLLWLLTIAAVCTFRPHGRAPSAFWQRQNIRMFGCPWDFD
jgi:hypothetical protein